MTKRSQAGGPQTPAEPEAQTPLDRAWAAYGAQDLAQAQREVQGVLDQSPHDVEAAYLAGLVARSQGEGDRATAAFQVVIDHHAQIADTTRARMLRRLAVGHLNQLARGQWDLEPETWVRT